MKCCSLQPEAAIMRYELSDNEWGIIRAMLPTKPRGIPRVDDRRVLNGIFWVLRSGAPWRDLPTIYGPRTTCYNRFVRWRIPPLGVGIARQLGQDARHVAREEEDRYREPTHLAHLDPQESRPVSRVRRGAESPSGRSR